MPGALARHEVAGAMHDGKRHSIVLHNVASELLVRGWHASDEQSKGRNCKVTNTV